MSVADYSQCAEDHQSLLLLVRPIAPLKYGPLFKTAWERVRRMTCIPIPNQKRVALVRYKDWYRKDLNDWGEFQAHRKVLGLISFATCSTLEEFEDVFESYKNEKEHYAHTIYNSRLIVLGMNTDGSPLSAEDKEKFVHKPSSPVPSIDSGVTPDLSPSDGPAEQEKTTELSGSSGGSDQDRKTNGGVGVHPLHRDEEESSKNKDEENPQDREPSIKFLKNLANEKPFSSNTVANSEKKPGSRPSSGSLSRENTGAEVIFYPSLEMARDLEEKIQEFVTSIFFVLEGKRLDRSFERQDRMQLLCAPFEKKDYVGVDTDSRSFRKKCQGRLRKHLADLCLQAGISGEAILHYQTAADILRSVNDWFWIGGCLEGICAASVAVTHPRAKSQSLLRRNLSLQADKNSSMVIDAKGRTGSLKSVTNSPAEDPVAQSTIMPDDIVEKYSEALLHYSKFRNVGMIEIEANLKACRALTTQRRFLQASEFLQNVVYINLAGPEEDKISRYCTLSQLYAHMGFARKSAFFKRIASMSCVLPQSSSPRWPLCHRLLSECLGGYKIITSTADIPQDKIFGWPLLQTRVFNELYYAARKMGHVPLAIRYLLLQIVSQYENMTKQEKRDAIAMLTSLTSSCPGNDQTLALESGALMPPVPLTNIPSIRAFRLLPMAPHLDPVKLQRKTDPTGPFIFAPQSYGLSDDSDSSHVEFRWVSRDLCEVQMQLFNPMPDELRIDHMTLMTEGVEIEEYPTNPTIPAESGLYLAKVLCRPKSSGELSILGYETNLLGVISKCHLRHLRALRSCPSKVTVIPALPQIQLTSSLPKAAMFSSVGEGAHVVTSGTTSLFAGESQECTVTIHNTSILRVEHLHVSLDCKPEEQNYLKKVFRWNDEKIQAQLPLAPNATIIFTLYIYGYTDFLPNRLSRSGSQLSSHSSSEEQDIRFVESLLRVEYSGGEGYEADYCRRCAIALTVDILPTVIFNHWDVVPAQISDHCVLVFDVCNMSSHIICLQYGTSDSVVCQPCQNAKIFVEIMQCEFPPDPEKCERLQRHNMVYEVDHHSQHVANFVDMNWTIPGTNHHGNVSAEHLVWSEQQLALIQTTVLSWNVQINGEMCNVHAVPDVRLGEVTDLSVQVDFKEAVESSNLVLCLDCVHERKCSQCPSESPNEMSFEAVSVLGSQAFRLPPITEPKVLEFSTCLMFHYTGVYNIELVCVPRGETENLEHCEVIYRCHEVKVRVHDDPP